MDSRHRHIGYCMTSEHHSSGHVTGDTASMTSSMESIAPTTSCSFKLLQLFHKVKDAKKPGENKRKKSNSRRRSPGDDTRSRDAGVQSHSLAATPGYSYFRGAMTSPEASNTIAIQTDWAEDVCDQVTDDLDLEDTPFSLTTDYLQARYLRYQTRGLPCVLDDLVPHTEKDSGLGGREGSIRQDESSEQEVTDDCFTPDGTTGFSSSSSQFADDVFCESKVTSSHPAMTSYVRLDSDRDLPRTFRDELELRCHVTRSPCQKQSRDCVDSMAERLQHVTLASEANDNQHYNVSSKRRQRRALSDGSEGSTGSAASVHSAGDVIAHLAPRDLAAVKQMLTSSQPHRVVPRMGTRVERGSQQPLTGCNYVTTPSSVTSPQLATTACQQQQSVCADSDTDTYCVLVPLSAVTNDTKIADTQRLHTIPEDFIESTLDVQPANRSNAKTTIPLSPEQLLMLAKRDFALQQAMTSSDHRQQASGASTCSGSGSDNSDSRLKELYNKYVDTMLTNEAHLAHTIALQQRMFLQQVSTGPGPAPGGSKPPPPVPTAMAPAKPSRLPQQQPTDDQPPTSRYVVKRRADGSRYITRKPLPTPGLARLRRKQLLEDRARRLTDERRTVATTTDDDEVNDDRRGHLMRVQKYKTRRQLQQQTGDGQQGEGPTLATPLPGTGSNKVCHLRPKAAALDDFTTLDEILVHGVKDAGKSRTASGGLLSVTTV